MGIISTLKASVLLSYLTVNFAKALPIIGLLLLLLVVNCNAQANATNLAKFEPPDGYAYMGGLIMYNEPAASNPSLPTQWEAMIGQKAAVLMSFRYFTAYDTFGNVSADNHPETDLQWCAAHNVTPMITWQPDRSNEAQYSNEDAVQAIADGQYDAYITARAEECKAFGNPIFIRFGQQFNYGGYAWSKHPAAYVEAWQRIVNIFRQVGATNVAFVWCPNYPSVDWGVGGNLNGQYVSNYALNYILQYWPGDSYVDWVGMDCYNIPNYERNLTRMLGEPNDTNGFYNYFCVQNNKPLFISEMGSSDNLSNTVGWQVSPDALNKAEWIHDSLNDIATMYPEVKGVTYWNDSVHGGSYALTGVWSWDGMTDQQWARYYLKNPRYLTSVQNFNVTPVYNVSSTHRWAVYNGTNAPIEQFLVKPGTTVSQSVQYNNTGTVPDSYNVSVSGIPSGWWSFTLYGNSTVQPGDGRYGNVYITPTTGGSYRFNVTVTSNGNKSVSSSQSYTLNVSSTPTPTPTATPTATPTPTPTPPSYNVTTTPRPATYLGMNASINQFVIFTGTTVSQGVYYQNTGTKPDSYSVSVSGIPSTWWSFILTGASTVQPGDGRYGNLAITPKTFGTYKFTVRVTSNGNPGVYSTQTYTLNVL